MAFIELENSTTADATDINNNFYHVAQGDRLPMGGDLLISTDSVYDLGSSSATWNNVFCDTLNINSPVSVARYADSVRRGYYITNTSNNIWNLIDETTVYSNSASMVMVYSLTGNYLNEIKIDLYAERTNTTIYSFDGGECRLYLYSAPGNTIGAQLGIGGAQRLQYVNNTLTAARFSNALNYIIQGVRQTSTGAPTSGYLQAFGSTIISLRAGFPKIGQTESFVCNAGNLTKKYNTSFFYSSESTIGTISLNFLWDPFGKISVKLWGR